MLYMLIRTQNHLPYTSFKQSTLLTTTVQKEELKSPKTFTNYSTRCPAKPLPRPLYINPTYEFEIKFDLKKLGENICVNRTVN